MPSRSLDLRGVDDFSVNPIIDKELTFNEKYNARCGFCHGADLNGIDGLGITLKNSLFLKNMSTDQTIEFLKTGRIPNSEDSVSGGVMPGFNWLDSSELEEIAIFIKNNNE
jgi:hypothetical protein